jgi:uncharacterized protein (TIGR00106 family)
MKVSVELSVIPIGAGVSIADYIADCCRILEAAGLNVDVGPNGTNVDGEWDTVFNAIKQCHEKLHNEDGVARLFTTLKVNTRTDKDQSSEEKVEAVRSKL